MTGMRHVISAAITAGVRRLVHISSPAVIFAWRDQHAVGDDAPYFGRHFSEYARTKQLAEPLAPAMGSESLDESGSRARHRPWGLTPCSRPWGLTPCSQFRFFDLMQPLDDVLAVFNAFLPQVIVGPRTLLALLAHARERGALADVAGRLQNIVRSTLAEHGCHATSVTVDLGIPSLPPGVKRRRVICSWTAHPASSMATA